MLQLSRSLRTATTDVAAEIRSARKKSFDKVRRFPDTEVVEEEEQTETADDPVAADKVEEAGSSQLLASQGELPFYDWLNYFRVDIISPCPYSGCSTIRW